MSTTDLIFTNSTGFFSTLCRIGQPQLHVLRESVVSFQVAFGTPKGSVFTQKFSSVIQRLKEAGLIDKWIRDKMDEVEAASSGAGGAGGGTGGTAGGSTKAWSLSQLQAPFIICGFLMGLAVISFGVELSISRLHGPSEKSGLLKHKVLSANKYR